MKKNINLQILFGLIVTSCAGNNCYQQRRGFGDYQTNPHAMSSHCLEIREMWEPDPASDNDSVTHNTRYQGLE